MSFASGVKRQLTLPALERGDEHRGLVARLEAISTDLGSRAALAKRAGIAPSSLQNYFDHSEPTRPVVKSRFAHAAYVFDHLARHRSRSQECRQSAEGYFGVAYADLRRGDRMYPLLGPYFEFRILNKSDFDERLITSTNCKPSRRMTSYHRTLPTGTCSSLTPLSVSDR